MSQTYVTCQLCGHQFPEHFVRERGSLQCSCGLRMVAPASSQHHHLRNILFLLVTAGLLVVAASIGRRFIG